jgi:hypothetical protein
VVDLGIAHGFATLGTIGLAGMTLLPRRPMRNLAQPPLEWSGEGGRNRFDAEINRIAWVVALKSPEHNVAKAQAYFERTLLVAQASKPNPGKLGAVMSMARVWRDQGKRHKARDLLAPVYGWFTEEFDTRDLKLGELAAWKR